MGSTFLLKKIFQRKMELKEMQRSVDAPQEVIQSEFDSLSLAPNEGMQDHSQHSDQENSSKIPDLIPKYHRISMIHSDDEGSDAISIK